jgi:hypothetical protein
MVTNSEVDLLVAFQELSATILDKASTDDVLDKVVNLAAASIEPCEMASISYREKATGTFEPQLQHVFTIAATDPKVLKLDEVQYATGQGPCVTVATQGGKERDAVIRVPDTSRDERWPKFSRFAYEAGIGSLSSFTLSVDGTIGALNLYAGPTSAFGEGDERAGILFAAYSATLITVTAAFQQKRRAVEQLYEALDTRDVIGRAKGMLMEREEIGDEQAFDVLRRLSQQLNIKLRDLAREIADREPPLT